MSTVDRECLRKFLEEHAKVPEKVPAAMGVMEPFFRIAETGQLGLAGSSERLAKSVEGAIGRATGKEVRRIELASLSTPLPGLRWMSEEVYEKRLRTSLANNLGDSPWGGLEGNLWNGLRISLWTSLGDSLRDSLWEGLWTGLRESFGNDLWDGLGNNLGDSLWDSLWNSLWNSLFHYLGFVLAGDEENVSRLTPLIELLPRAVPFGVKSEGTDEPGVWLVLVA